MERTKVQSTILAMCVMFTAVSCRNIQNAAAISPSPTSTDCSAVVYDMMDCVPFLTDSNDTEPDTSCCSGLESVIAVDSQCLCVALQGGEDMGIDLNLTKAFSLPKLCGLSTVVQCQLSDESSRSSISPVSQPPSHSPASGPAAIVSPVAQSPTVQAAAPTTEAMLPASRGVPTTTDSHSPAPAPANEADRSVSSFIILLAFLLHQFV